ncbi:rho guanine nucleotide exchange factor 17-like [Pollicipes pollicipes]|uniref:rho guanine nucleotide exchange factor 17-like n=1 Tax=Pollicipes pollicipes TaxID=41117 RepID=UPI0018859972|nr:rho guanine nucleotide exchange factor 17-like [Pollicipes pollicipes]
MTTSAGTKRERCLLLFSDLLVIAGIKRRPGSTTRKQTPPLHNNSTNGLEPNKYKFLMKIPLSDVIIARDHSEEPSVLMKEVERIDQDISTLRQMGVLVCKLHSNHHQVEELVREMAHVLNRELTERHRADSQLLMLRLQVTSEECTENITASFSDVDKRVTWEQLFNQTKHKLVESLDQRPVPRFLQPIPVRKTRAGLQFTCAAPTLAPHTESGKDVWVCNSDGYVGQICTLSLRPEPAVTSCNGVCNSRILCMVPVPSHPARRRCRVQFAADDAAPRSAGEAQGRAARVSSGRSSSDRPYDHATVPNYQVEELVREMAHVLNRELTERHRADSQLLMLRLQVTSEECTENITASFSDVDKRVTWEQLFNQTKHKLVESLDQRPVPRFLQPIPVRKTRAGLQFTCAAPTLAPHTESGKDVWVCNSDGYVGQICTLSLRPEPAVTSCNGVCNSRILCMVPVPSHPARRRCRVQFAADDAAPRSAGEAQGRAARVSSGRSSSDSSSESDSSADESKCGLRRGMVDESKSRRPRGAADESKPSGDQPTMWLGTEDGCIYIYNCSDYVRVKRTTVKVQLGSAVHAMVYLEGRVFASLGSGAVSAFRRAAGGAWDLQSPLVIQVSARPVNRLASVLGKLWACTHNLVKVVDPSTDTVQHTVTVSSSAQAAVRALAHSGLGVWLSFVHTTTLRLFHASTFDLVCEVDVTPAVTRMLAGCDDIIRQHKTACLRVTALMVCRSLLWIGTSAGVILNLPLPPLGATTSWISSTLSIAGISHGHTGHVRFLSCVDCVDPAAEVAAPARGKRYRRDQQPRLEEGTDTMDTGVGKMLVISGGDGYEDFRSSGSELSGRDDSTNHLLLWSV